MPLYSSELEVLKSSLVKLRRFNSFTGYEGEELKASEYKNKNYDVSYNIKQYLDTFVKEQTKDILSFSKTDEVINQNVNMSAFSDFFNKTDNIIEEDKKYTSFSSNPIELLFDKIDYASYHQLNTPEGLNTESRILIDLCKIFQNEVKRLKKEKSTVQTVMTLQKINKVYEKVINGKVNEAATLLNRFYNDNSKDITLSYLYAETLFAKVGLGHQKSISKARDIFNNVCFLTDKSNDELLSYYRYIYVCREYSHDPARALELFRGFVLIDPDKFRSSKLFTQKSGFNLKCLLLFLRFDIDTWNAYEIETMYHFTSKAISGGIFYILFIRKTMLNHLESVRYHDFLQTEIDLYNLSKSHSKIINNIVSNFNSKALPNNGSSYMHTVGQKYIQTFFISSKLPDFYEYLTNTSISCIHYLEDTSNDKELAKNGLGEHSFWRIWISKITDVISLQRADILPYEQVLKESALLNQYENIILRAKEYEQEVFDDEKYEEYRKSLQPVTQKGLISIMLGENNYSVFDYGIPWNGIRDYYNHLKYVGINPTPLASNLIMEKGKVGLIWNLEELQMLSESLNLIIDNKNLSLKARLENVITLKENEAADNVQYITLAEHFELYWWLYVLLIVVTILLSVMVN